MDHTTTPPVTATADAWAVLRSCPEAFAAVDTDLHVTAWNPAAERLTGFTEAQAVGRPLPHLTPSQLLALRESMDAFDRWSTDVPIVLPRRHASGRTIQVTVTAYVPLVGPDGEVVGFGSFFRAVRPSDNRSHTRNVYSRRLATSRRWEDATDALRLIIEELLGADRGYLLRRTDDGWTGWLAAGDQREVAEGIVVTDPHALDSAVHNTVCRMAMLQIDGADRQVMLVPAGPASAHTLLALVSDRTLGDVDTELAMALASEAWATLSRVQAVEELEGKVEMLEAIAGVAATAGLDLGSVTTQVTSLAARALSCERAALYLYDEESELHLAAFHAEDRDWTVSDDDVQMPGRSSARTMAAEMLADVQHFLAQDARTCDWLAGPWDPEEGTVSLYGMPLRVGDHDIGLLVVAHTTANPRGFTSLCTQVGSALSGQAALAISNAQLFGTQRSTAERLRDIDRQRSDWVAGITHDLRTPVTAIVGFAGTLRRAGARMTEDERDEALSIIQRQSLRVSRMLEDMMDSARAVAGELRPDRRVPVSLAQCVADAVVVTPPSDQRRVVVADREDVMVCGDAGQLTRVVQNLLVNALDHAPGSTTIDVAFHTEGDVGELVVADHGPGLPPDVDLFTPYGRGPTGGTGLGLYTVKQIVEMHGGTIATEQTPGGGATLRVRLPRVADDVGCA